MITRIIISKVRKIEPTSKNPEAPQKRTKAPRGPLFLSHGLAWRTVLDASCSTTEWHRLNWFSTKACCAKQPRAPMSSTARAAAARVHEATLARVCVCMLQEPGHAPPMMCWLTYLLFRMLAGMIAEATPVQTVAKKASINSQNQTVKLAASLCCTYSDRALLASRLLT